MPFAGLWFGRSFGQYLSYGERESQAQTYDGMMEWAEGLGEVIGAMSAPLKFVAASEEEEATVLPTVSVRKGWDARWVAAVGSYILLVIVLSLVERRWRRKGQPVSEQ